MSSGPQGPGQRYFPNQQNPSSANLLSGRSPGPPSASPPGPQATFSKAPSVRSYDSAALEESRYNIASTRGSVSRPSSLQPSISEKFHLAPDPAAWGSDISHAEADDVLHDPRRDRKSNNIFTSRGLSNVGCIALLALIIVGVFLGYPVATNFAQPIRVSNLHVNLTGQVPQMSGNWALIDHDTPKEVYDIPSYHDPSKTMKLVFSDEFETDGRSFYPGDDPYWEAMDLHYWQTNNLEWYDPAAITTRGGALEINLTKMETHNLSYQGGLMSSWNKFCFTGGLIVTSVRLPGMNNIFGLWPAVWTMGNLGRAGYGASLDGMWPYSYDACDVGTLPNQTISEGNPPAATTLDDKGNPVPLSYLPGQRLSRCTCAGESHPGPIHKDGSYVGRSAPEIDIIEAQIGGEEGARVGQVSQSAQWAPFDKDYLLNNASDVFIIKDLTLSHKNSYSGGFYQQAASVVSTTNQQCYQLIGECFAVHGFEYQPGFDDGYITWLTDNKVMWTMRGGAVGADPDTKIAARPVTEEPMYILANLGISRAFGFVDFEHLTFPSTMLIDWIRVYQDPNAINIGCDPPNRPTSAYINTYIEAYTNPLLTTWVDDYKQTVPKNNLTSQC
ncbi:beta-glucan synthesis-associated [Mycena rebaudengoi]|nr:beta-glucan synthesis-associated [Mycena rebaudengoi]